MRKSKVGTVVRHTGDKTAVVVVSRLVKHPEFQKYLKRRKRFHVHDERNELSPGDRVKIVECRPISKTKSWRVHSIVKKSERAESL